MKLTDPWEKLAAAYRLKGDHQAIELLLERRPNLAGAIGDQFTREPTTDWQRAVEIYSRGVEAQPTDVSLLSKRAFPHEALKNWDAALADWSRAVAGNPERAKLLAEFARRLAAAGQVRLAKAQFQTSQALCERMLEADPESDVMAGELNQLLLAKAETESPTRWKVLEPTEMKSSGGARLTRLADDSILAGGTNPPSDRYGR
jgi:tetratricopeptide (TPR) repeat protein